MKWLSQLKKIFLRLPWAVWVGLLLIVGILVSNLRTSGTLVLSESNWALLAGAGIALASLWLIVKFAWFIYAYAKTDIKPDYYINNPHEEALASVVRQLRRRARALRRVSWLTLAIMVLAIGAGMLLFSSADIAASRAQIENASLNERRFLESLTDLAYRQAKIQDSLDRAITIGDEGRTLDLQDQLETVNVLLEDLRSSVARGDFFSPTQQDSDYLVFVVSSLSTKLGSILLLLFLIKILINLYRYTLQLAAFYDARADCIQASVEDTAKDLNAFLSFFSTDNLRLGVVPSSPTEQAIEMAKEMASAISKAKEK